MYTYVYMLFVDGVYRDVWSLTTPAAGPVLLAHTRYLRLSTVDDVEPVPSIDEVILSTQQLQL